jgi:hypothetical protein
MMTRGIAANLIRQINQTNDIDTIRQQFAISVPMV